MILESYFDAAEKEAKRSKSAVGTHKDWQTDVNRKKISKLTQIMTEKQSLAKLQELMDT